MASKFHPEESLNLEMQHVSTVRREYFSFRWIINNFQKFMNRKYNFSSPQFSPNLPSGASKWKLIVFPDNIYPEGTHVALRLVNLSEDGICYSVMYTISFSDLTGKPHELKIGEKVFGHYLDFDECPVVSNRVIKEKCLLQDDSLVITCDLDILICENENNEICKSFEDSAGVMYKSSPENNSSALIPVVKDLSKPLNIVIHDDKNINALLRQAHFPKTENCDIESSNRETNEALTKLSDDLQSLYVSKDEWDITIIVKDGKLYAHKLMLSSRCDYFKNIFKFQHCSDITIPNMSVATLNIVLHYLYTGSLLYPITENAAIDLLTESEHLNLPHLATLTQSFLKLRLNVFNVIDIFKVAKKLKMNTLKYTTLKFVKENQKDVTQTNQWHELMINDPHSAGEMLLTASYRKI